MQTSFGGKLDTGLDTITQSDEKLSTSVLGSGRDCGLLEELCSL